MLGKLLKHEFKTTSKMILPLYLALVVLTIFARITAQSMFSANETLTDSLGFGIFSGTTIVMYILGLFAVSIATFIYLVMRFYKNLFSAEGYLMHTLPVTSWQLLSSKLIVSFVWSLAETLLIAFSIFCIFANDYTFEVISDFFAAYGGFGAFIDYSTGLSLGAFWTLMILFMIIGLLSGYLLPYVSICIGQLWQKHKTAGSFLTYFGITILLQIISSIYSGFTMNGYNESYTVFIPVSLYIVSLIFAVISSIVFFLLSGYIMQKKINLD